MILAFVVIGVVTYRVTAPPRESTDEGFSLGRVLQHAMADLRGQNATADVTRTASVEVPAAVTRLVVPGFTGQLTILGEDRADVRADLTATVFGADEADAKARAAGITLELSALDDALTLELEQPESRRRPRVDLKVVVPRRLAVEVEASGGRLDVRHVAGLALEAQRTETTLGAIGGTVSGEQRDGALEVVGARAVSLSSRRVSLRLEGVSGPITGEFVDGRLFVRESKGPFTLDTRRVSVELDGAPEQTRIDAVDGRVVLRNQRGPVAYDGERAPLSVSLAGPASVEATSADGAIDVTLAPGEGATVDLEAEDGAIRLPQDDLAPATEGRIARVRGEVGGGGPPVRVRTTRAGIVIRR